MARRKNSNPFHGEDEPEADISPLIDVAFLLLIYFLVSAQLIDQEADLGLQLPGLESLSNEPVETDQMMIKIAANSVVTINDEIVESNPSNRRVPNLARRLNDYAKSTKLAKSEPIVVIDCHDDAVEQRFIDVLNACNKAGINNISLAN